MAEPQSRTVPRRKQGTLNDGFRVRFVERCYDACSRWYNDDWQKHVSGVPQDPHRLLDRAQEVKDQVDCVHSDKKYYGDDSIFLQTCVDPTCTLRGWEAVEFGSATNTWVACKENFGSKTLDHWNKNRAWDRVHTQLRAMAQGEWDDLQFPCATCGGQRPIFPFRAIEDKWIYVLKEAGQTLKPVQEIYSKTETSGDIYFVLEGGRFSADHCKPYEGYLDVPDLTQETWHFFLSPVKLGRKALEVLCRLKEGQDFYDRERGDADPRRWNVPVMRRLQPWVSTVPRRFSKPQIEIPLGEYIPLIDPFAWAAAAVEVDYMPILEAQRALIGHRDEQAKAFIAGALAEATTSKRGGTEDGEGAAASGERDHWSLEGELSQAPPSYSSSDNVATAWLERHRALANYLSKECDYACCRVFFPVLFSQGHLVVEVSLQEHGEWTRFMAFGISHWLHLLSQAAACRAGRIFLRAAARSNALANRIPQKNVLGGELLGSGSAYIKEQTAALPAQLFGFLAGAIIEKPSNAAKDIARHLNDIGTKAWTVEDKYVDVADKGLDFAIEHMKDYIGSLDRRMLMASLSLAQRESPGERAMIFGWKAAKGAKIMTTFLGVLIRFSKWNEEREKIGKSAWETAEAIKPAVEIGAGIVPQFVLEQWKGVLEKRIDDAAFNAAKELGKEELEALEKTVARAETLESGIWFVSGPVACLLGALDVIIETHSAIESAEAGDSGAMWGHGVIAAGALIGLFPTVAVMLYGAESVAWAGPVGIVAAIIMAGGAVIIATCSKNDLQMFAMHCFLGKEYGQGGWKETGKPWMAECSWSGLRYEKNSREADDRFLLQRAALLRMLCGYTTMVVSDHHSGSCYIYPRLIPDGGTYEIKVEFSPLSSPEGPPVATYTASILAGQHKFQWTSDAPPNPSTIEFEPDKHGGGTKWIRVVISPKALREVTPVFSSRLLLDPTGKFSYPAKGWVVDGK